MYSYQILKGKDKQDTFEIIICLLCDKGDSWDGFLWF